VRVGENALATVPGAAFAGTEFVPFRCDYLLASAALATRARHYTVVRDDRAGRASDHYPVFCDFD
jgi:exodeoxyribonuclease III